MRFSLINSSLICQLYSLFIFHNFYRREINILIPHNSHSTIIRFLFSLFWLKETVDHDSKVLWFHEFCTKFNFVYGSLLGWRASEALSVHVLLFFFSSRFFALTSLRLLFLLASGLAVVVCVDAWRNKIWPAIKGTTSWFYTGSLSLNILIQAPYISFTFPLECHVASFLY